jgi:hypothetical protein
MTGFDPNCVRLWGPPGVDARRSEIVGPQPFARPESDESRPTVPNDVRRAEALLLCPDGTQMSVPPGRRRPDAPTHEHGLRGSIEKELKVQMAQDISEAGVDFL